MEKNLNSKKAEEPISPDVIRALQSILESATLATSSSSDPTIGKIVEEVDLLKFDPSSSHQDWEAAAQALQNVETNKKQLADHLSEAFLNFERLERCMDVLKTNSPDAPVKLMTNQTIKEQIIEDVNQLVLKLEELEGRLQALQLSKVSDKKLNGAASGSQPASTDLKGKGKSKEVRKKRKKNLPRKC